MQSDSVEEWNNLSPAEKAKSLKEAADNARREDNYQVAYGYYIQALQLYRGLEDSRSILRVLINLGNLAGRANFHDGLGMFARRRLLAEEAIPLAREVGNASLLAAALCAFSGGITDVKPLDALEEGLKLARLSGDKSTIARVLTRLASHLHIHEYERANELRLEALKLYQELDDKAAVASVLVRLAIRAKGTEKRDYLESAHQIQREIGTNGEFRIKHGMLGCYYFKHDLARCETLNEETLTLARRLDDRRLQASCLNRLAELASMRGEGVRAEALRNESSGIYTPSAAAAATIKAFAALEASRTSGDADQDV